MEAASFSAVLILLKHQNGHREGVHGRNVGVGALDEAIRRRRVLPRATALLCTSRPLEHRCHIISDKQGLMIDIEVWN